MNNKSVKFSEFKNQIQEALNKIDSINEELFLIDGFTSQPLHKELTGAFVVGGPTIPMVVAVGKKTGMIYFFALKALIPNLDI